MKLRRPLILCGLCLAVLTACRRDDAERRIAVAFLEAVRLQDTATIRYLAEPDQADALVSIVIEHPLDITIVMAVADPRPRVYRVEQSTFVYFPAAGIPGDDAGVTVALAPTTPRRVVGLQLHPDLRFP